MGEWYIGPKIFVRNIRRKIKNREWPKVPKGNCKKGWKCLSHQNN